MRRLRMDKNQIVEVTIEDLSREGEGIGHVEGYTLFVKDAVIGDRIRARITRPKKNFAYARTEEILRPSPDRVTPRCPEARRCGGCTLQAMSYEAQLAFKRQLVADALHRIGGFDVSISDSDDAGDGSRTLYVRPVLGMEEPFRYRNKAQYPIAWKTADGAAPYPAAGFYAARTHSLIEVRDCVLTPESFSRIVDTFLAYMRKYRVSAYDENTGEGLIRHLLLRKAFSTGEILVCPVINGERLPHSDELTTTLREQHGVCSVCINVNRKKGNAILGDRTIPLFGNPWITDLLGGMSFRISPRSFYQVNPVQTEVLYREALRAADLKGDELVYDLYCGIGTISLYLAQKARVVYGVEIVPEAIRDAKENAERNGIANAHFYVGAAEQLLAAGEFAPGVPCPRPDVVVLDPPRKGCDASLIDAVLRLAPDRIVYVSCDPATLARDLRRFYEGNETASYRPSSVQPVEMFSQTVHVESCVLLERVSNRKADSYVKLNVKMADYYRIKDSAETENAEE